MPSAPAELWTVRNPVYLPPGGKWFYTVPETNVYVECLTTLAELVYRVRRHYEQNQLPVPENLRAVIEDYICRRVAGGYCNEGAGSANRQPSFFEAVAATEKLMLAARGWPRGEPDVDSRANTCCQCSENLLGMCTTCNGLRATARRMAGRPPLKQAAYLGICGVTACVVEGQVHLDVAKLGEWSARRKDWPANCWVGKS